MISGFVCSCHGFMSSGDMKSYLLFEAGTKRDGWFTNDMLIQQFNDSIQLIKNLHPDMKLLFAFDNSMSHHKRPPDGLDASLLPLKDNGKNAPIMRSTSFMKDGVLVQQSMQTESGEAKGIRTILTERGKWRANMLLTCQFCSDQIEHHKRVYTAAESFAGTSQCCARFCLAHEPDFMEQKEWLTEVIESNGCEIIFYPKFHCELNFIELLWAQLKRHLRENPTKSLQELKSTVVETLENMPISTV